MTHSFPTRRSSDLSLVRGEPFTGVGLDYAWTAPTRTAVQTAVIDVADELGEILLAAGDLRGAERAARAGLTARSEEHTSELQSLMRISYAVFCLTKKKNKPQTATTKTTTTN